jgi:Interferon-related developmental regulator (IFRD)
MSRWDALKSDKAKKFPKSHYERSLSKFCKGEVVNSNFNSFEDMLSKIALASTKEEIELLVQDMTNLDAVFLRKCPAERVALHVFSDFLIKNLQRVDTSIQFQKNVLAVISILLQVSCITSAVLAPLTTDVSPTSGIEERIPNPIGKLLLDVLTHKLPVSCATLTLFLGEVRKRSIADTLPLNFVQISVFFKTYILQGMWQSLCLELLRLTLLTYPESNITLKLLLLSEPHVNLNSQNCPTCGYIKYSSPLMDILHGRNCDDQVFECISCLLKSFPLEPWLRKETAGSMKLFGESVKNDLAQLIRILRCRFSTSECFCKLITVVLTIIPYSVEGSDRLTQEAIKLVAYLVKSILKSPSPPRTHLIESICECMGGRLLPSGLKTTIAIPIKLWLQDSHELLEYFVQSFGKENFSNRKSTVQLLCAILRTQPMFMDEQSFRMMFQDLSSRMDYQLEVMKVISSYVEGRCEYALQSSIGYDEETSIFLVQTLIKGISDSSSETRIVALRGFCSLLGSDWAVAIKINCIWNCVDHILNCSDVGKSNERQLALRAIGEMVMKCCYSQDINDDIINQLCIKIFPALKQNLDQRLDIAKQAMSILGMGNLYLGICQRNSTAILLPGDDILEVLEELEIAMSSVNDKVSGNAIRCIGHLCMITFREPYVSILEKEKLSEKFRTITRKVTEKICHGIGGACFSGLTWKERSCLKKHAWGSCHTLGLILDCDLSLENLVDSREACIMLTSCLQKYKSISEKIVISAITALERINLSRLEIISRRSGLIGSIVVTCLTMILEQDITSRIATKVHELLQHVVPILSVLDARVILEAKEVTSAHLEWLYNWMIQTGMIAEPYEVLAMACEMYNGWNAYVGLEQRFSSRASWGYREGSYISTEDEDEI